MQSLQALLHRKPAKTEKRSWCRTSVGLSIPRSINTGGYKYKAHIVTGFVTGRHFPFWWRLRMGSESCHSRPASIAALPPIETSAPTNPPTRPPTPCPVASSHRPGLSCYPCVCAGSFSSAWWLCAVWAGWLRCLPGLASAR